MANTAAQEIPARQQVRSEHAWDLSKLFKDDEAWEQGLAEFNTMVEKIPEYKGTLSKSAGHLHDCLAFLSKVEMLGERLGYYAHLRHSEDAGDSKNQERLARFAKASSDANTAQSFVEPEIHSIDTETLEGFMEDQRLADYRVQLNKLIRMKPHILSEAEERLLAMQSEANQTASKTFSALTDVDFDFGSVDTPEGPKPLSQSTLSSFMLNPNRDVRERAFTQFYRVYEAHQNTLASLYSGSVQLDVYKSRARGFENSRAAALFPDDVPERVYDNLVETVNNNLDTLHRYYALRKRTLDLPDFRLYDTYTPLVPDLTVHHTYEQAVDRVTDALAPLGEEYTSTLRNGLLGGWVDRYENKGKRSGAFSAGSYEGDPYILMNYKEDVLRDVFTLAHEGGHSMHSWYSARHNPFPHYSYTIFEAEVASTFNEQLLLKAMIEHADDERMRTYLVNKHVDDMVATLFRQTMFAEFEHVAHTMVEEGTPLTVDSIRNTYRGLQEKFFGPDAVIDEMGDLEGLRIPHFYRAFYVYKYATGISAAISLAQRVLEGGRQELDDYFAFLKSGGSRFPIESLRLAGVDMESPEPIETAMKVFRGRVEELESLLGGTG
ncbi:MAG: oligoendopeptidase F [Spirochaetales bacterium]